MNNQETYTIPLPLSIQIKKKGPPFQLNLNIYRNAHFYTLDKAKELFEKIVKERIQHLPRMKKLRITYILYSGSNRMMDVANICSIVDKFFCDTLVNSNILPDDNMTILPEVEYKFGNVDKENPRVDAIISNIEFEEPMKIIITADEVHDLLMEHVRKTLNLNNDQDVSVTYNESTAGYDVDLKAPAKTAQVSKPAELGPQQVVEEQKRVLATTATSTQQSTEQAALMAKMSDPSSNEAKPASTDSSGLSKLFDSVPTTTATQAPTATAQPNSLFGNLNKPVNTKPSE